MDQTVIALLAVGMLVAAFGYASVGHGGASAYIAAMALAGIAPQEMRPIALLLNVLVSSLATWKFHRAGYFRWRLFWPFAAVSIPLAYVGAAMGLLAGLTGVGGGIFLSPLLLMLGWAGTKQTSAVAAPFILVNSAAGLAAVFVSRPAALPEYVWILCAAVLAGGWLGAEYGSRRFANPVVRRVLAI